MSTDSPTAPTNEPYRGPERRKAPRGSEGPQCPHCRESTVSRVLQSRTYGTIYRRRRECTECGKRFSTQEDLQQSA